MASFPEQVNVANTDIPVKITALKSQERKISENCTFLVVLKLVFILNSEIHNSQIRGIEHGEDNFNFLHKLKAFCLYDKHVLRIKAMKYFFSSDLLTTNPADLCHNLQYITS